MPKQLDAFSSVLTFEEAEFVFLNLKKKYCVCVSIHRKKSCSTCLRQVKAARNVVFRIAFFHRVHCEARNQKAEEKFINSTAKIQ